VAPFDGGYKAWRAAVADGWTAASELARRPGASPAGAKSAGAATPASNGRAAMTPMPTVKEERPRLSKDAYRREHRRIEADLRQLAERKALLEAGLQDSATQANFVELRRLGSELADVDSALGQAEDAWLTLEERAPR
jgi:hypothetical protein